MNVPSGLQPSARVGRVAVVLSALALVVSVAGWLVRSPSTGAPERAPAIPTALTEPPVLDSSQPVDCRGEGPVADVGDLMQVRINPAMTRLSFALHHLDSEDRLAKVADAARDLVGCVHLAPKYPPDIALARYGEYYQLTDEMGASALALMTSAQEGDDAGAHHWFLHLKQSCVACHARFRTADAR